MRRRQPGEPPARPPPRRPRAGKGLSLHAVSIGGLSLPASSDLLGVCRRGARPTRPLGRLVDDACAAAALSPVGYVRHRPGARDGAAPRAVVRTLALRAMDLGSARGL